MLVWPLTMLSYEMDHRSFLLVPIEPKQTNKGGEFCSQGGIKRTATFEFFPSRSREATWQDSVRTMEEPPHSSGTTRKKRTRPELLRPDFQKAARRHTVGEDVLLGDKKRARRTTCLVIWGLGVYDKNSNAKMFPFAPPESHARNRREEKPVWGPSESSQTRHTEGVNVCTGNRNGTYMCRQLVQN